MIGIEKADGQVTKVRIPGACESPRLTRVHTANSCPRKMSPNAPTLGKLNVRLHFKRDLNFKTTAFSNVAKTSNLGPANYIETFNSKKLFLRSTQLELTTDLLTAELPSPNFLEGLRA